VYEVSFPPHPGQYSLLFVLLMMSILTGVRWNLNVVLISISFMARTVDFFLNIFTSGRISWLLLLLSHWWLWIKVAINICMQVFVLFGSLSCGTGVWIEGLHLLGKQSTTWSLLLELIFHTGASAFSWGWPCVMILLLLSQPSIFIGMFHHTQLAFYDRSG
jgi:hypothetical protein